MASHLDDEILDSFKEFAPSSAYLMGFDDYAGKLFIPSQENVDAALRKVRELKGRAETELQRKSLDSMETALRFDEPQPVLDDIVGSIFALLVKEGIKDEHMLLFLKNAADALDASTKRYSGKNIPVGVKALVLYRLGSVVEILDTVNGQTKSAEVKAACDALKTKASEYVGLFQLEGFGHGEFQNVEKVFKRDGFDLGRQSFYPDALSKALDYGESPEELEKNAMAWIDEELPKFRKATEALAKKLGCKTVPEAVETAINSRMKLDPKKLLRTTQQIRKVIQPLVNQDVHGINPKYRTKVIETPPYLTGTIPTGAAQFFNTYTKKPFQVFFQTTDPKRDPDKSVTGLMNLLVHEEYGHCVHHSNSVMGFVGKISALQLLPALPTGGPITEGLSFNRELEFLEASKKLETKKKLTKAERDYVKSMAKFGGLKLINLELEFWTRRWRIVRFLRVIGDVRINTGKQGLLEFVDWANERTGVPRSSVYFQLFPAHEGMFPGYATSYAVVGQEIRALERRIKDDRKRVKFSTYLCSVGFPPRSIYVRMLKDYVKKLK
ncbi:MAG: hypothetical protein LYZ69_08975 [Nitrososphaerales archaeon]|nr:hypothetical protein [Nitrososphaerales archaeon]